MILPKIIQAPMAGGVTTPGFVATVANCGALGSLAAGYMLPEAIRENIRKIRQMTDRAFNVNLFIPGKENPMDTAHMSAFLQLFWDEFGSHPSEEKEPIPVFEEQVAALIEERVPIFSFTFGIPPQEVILAFHSYGAVLIGTATSVREAQCLDAAGIDMIVCQGLEAGGHRGTFLEDSSLSTMELLSEIKKQVSRPLIASGGIMDAKGVHAALEQGAVSVQMGTAFLTTHESGAHPTYKKALLHKEGIATSISRAFSGKYARAVTNRLMMAIEGSEITIPEYPQQHFLTCSLRSLSAEKGHPDLMALYAGQNANKCQACSAQELIQSLTLEDTL